jgi:plastocyanin
VDERARPSVGGQAQRPEAVVCATAGAFAAGALFYQPDSGSNTATAAPAGTVQIKGFAFQAAPAKRAGSITIVNRDGVGHTMTAGNGAFNLKIGGNASIAFRAPAKPGTYTFFCAIHPEMTGTLVVA